MYIVEKVSQLSSKLISKQLNYNKDQEEVLAYGIFGFLHILLTVVIILMVAHFTQLTVPVTIILIVSSALRSFSGGAHCSSPMRCLVAGVFTLVALGLFVKLFSSHTTILYYKLYITLCYIISILIIVRYSPVDSPNKPIKRPETRRRLKKGSFVVILISVTLAILVEFIYPNISLLNKYIINMSIGTGLIWQSFTLHPSGHVFVNQFDRILKYIIK